MSKIKIVIPNESDEHAAWREKLAAIEATDPEARTQEQWDTVAGMYESEPAYGEGGKTYYVPGLDEMPATKIKSLPKELFDEKNGNNAGFDAMVALLSMYMPKKAANSLSIGQMQEIFKLVKGNSTGES